MGLFDDLFGGKNTTTTKDQTSLSSNTTGQQSQTNQTAAQQDTTQQQSQSSSSTTQGKTQQTSQSTGQTAQNTQTASNQVTAGSQTVSSLDAETVSLLKSLLTPTAGVAAGQVGSNVNSDALKKISSDLYAKATGGNASDVQRAVEASTASAKLNYETGEGQEIARTQQAIGSTQNTYSKLLSQKGLNDLNTQIATIVAQGALQADQLNSADFNAAADAIVKASSVAGNDATAALAPVLQIISALKGAQTSSQSSEQAATTGTTSAAGTTTESNVASSVTNSATQENTLANLLSSLKGTTEGQSDTTQSGTLSQVQNTTGTQQTKTSKGIIGDILSIF